MKVLLIEQAGQKYNTAGKLVHNKQAGKEDQTIRIRQVEQKRKLEFMHGVVNPGA